MQSKTDKELLASFVAADDGSAFAELVSRYSPNLRGLSEQAAAAAVGYPLGSMKRRASEGLAKLRVRLAKRGVALSGVALTGLFPSEASAAVPETLLPSILAPVQGTAATTAVCTDRAEIDSIGK